MEFIFYALAIFFSVQISFVIGDKLDTFFASFGRDLECEKEEEKKDGN